MHKGNALLLAGVALACSSVLPTVSLPSNEVVSNDPVRIALATAADSGAGGGVGHWRYYDARHQQISALGATDGRYLFDRAGQRVRITRPGGSYGTYEGAIVLEATDRQSFVTWNQKRYRGQIVVTPTDSGLLVVNRLGMEDYLRGVVPLEIGKRRPDERAAVEAQAVAARSYSYLHLAPARAYDMVATVQDQVYGGVDAETPLSDTAVASTAGVVVKYAGRVISTPYHSTCGGSTAAVHEVWYDQPDEPYLRPVSDRIPGTNRFYCDSSPRFNWTRSFDRASLRSALEKYLWAYTTAPRGAIGRVTGISERGRTESGRVAALSIQTDRGNYTLKGNDIRFVLRDASNTILNSTYFTPDATVSGGEVTQLTITGRGNGHGIGMCQWGAIGRARAGQDYKTILATYYPGTTIGRM
jgi:stage II sporulation protein D